MFAALNLGGPPGSYGVLAAPVFEVRFMISSARAASEPSYYLSSIRML